MIDLPGCLCVRPTRARVVPDPANIRASAGQMMRLGHDRNTHCDRGHPPTKENAALFARGGVGTADQRNYGRQSVRASFMVRSGNGTAVASIDARNFATLARSAALPSVST